MTTYTGYIRSDRKVRYISTNEYLRENKHKNTLNTSHLYDNEDACEICEKNSADFNCDKCGNCICGNLTCSMQFPHYYGTVYYVCNCCVNTIEQKLMLQIDLGKLTLLKDKIQTGNTRTNSRNNSVCSISTGSSNNDS